MAILLEMPLLAQTTNKTSFEPGTTFKDCPDCPEMVVIPEGSFMMGSPENEPGRFPEEGPQRQVGIKQFAAGKFEVTRDEWAAFVKATNRVTTGGCSWAAIPGDTAKQWVPNPTANWNNLAQNHSTTIQ